MLVSTSCPPPHLVPPGPPSPSLASNLALADDHILERIHDQGIPNKIYREYAAALTHEGIHYHAYQKVDVQVSDHASYVHIHVCVCVHLVTVFICVVFL